MKLQNWVHHQKKYVRVSFSTQGIDFSHPCMHDILVRNILISVVLVLKIILSEIVINGFRSRLTLKKSTSLPNSTTQKWTKKHVTHVLVNVR